MQTDKAVVSDWKLLRVIPHEQIEGMTRQGQTRKIAKIFDLIKKERVPPRITLQNANFHARDK
jgi:NADH:ubiquinone oxidoreductase subunit F (NADH-binding)